MPTVSVILVNFNGERLLGDCFNSLKAQTYRDFDTVFVDNGSSDNSLKVARELMPEIRSVALEGNTGFAGGNNAGLKESRGKYIVLLNNDTECAPDFLAELVRAIESAPKDVRVGMVAPKILSFFDRTQIDSVGGLLMGPDGIGIGRGRGERDEGQYDALTDILMPSGCAALLTREMLDETGLFADDFFAYCEDMDFGLRAVWAGWNAVSAPRAVVYHKYSASSSSYSAFKMQLVERNHYFVALKNFTLAMLVAFPFWTWYRYLLMLYAVLCGKGKGRAAASEKITKLIGAFIKGHWQALLGTPRQLRRRRKIKRRSSLQFRLKLKPHRTTMTKIILSE
ncbi:MAG TPA: glycosyltransferase family 2 protein [Planctomycetota bacterium]|nr:glycosyltransferase family 2 protein [Planctomycetota bacterium]